MLSILNFVLSVQFFCLLVLKAHNLPSLIEVTVTIVHLTIRLVEGLCVVNPVLAILVNRR